jgi:hypothetical protein
VSLANGDAPDATELELREPLLDGVAQQQLVARLREIALERERACAVEDFERAAALDEEHERIGDELSRAGAAQRGGRGGAFATAGERARKAVAKAISEAVARIGAHAGAAPLAAHFSSAVRKGQWLSYTAATPWTVDLPGPRPRR